ncbi:enoyl-CoA hydratase-related protein [Trichlorobacter ammonificans]|uniref:Crotonyl-CoA hydratase n=1 Tax=Trichlorobacter ammonificans TaxID=2916410 RepID=A0ABM9D9V1_9BACT|nr:enoyl-CoA hydratase-related protein [Trichlorobacter ammonificans]CAH2031923.1 Crotonyl-CoA hydratase [Trichlorobacter ammonificans]
MSYETLLTELSEGVATITVNRPSAMNAMTTVTLRELDDAVRTMNAAKEVRAIIITGAGEKAFIAGGDIALLRDMGPLEARELAQLAQGLCSAIEQGGTPVIAAVNGYALGGGCELAMSCDIRIAAETARFGQPEVNIGILPGFGGSQRLPRLVGKGRALEMILTGDMIDAQEAYRIGLVNRVVPAAELMATARELARKLAAKSPLALRLCKEAVMNGVEMELTQACRYEAELFAVSFGTEDQKEGMSAFLEKRPARFTGA